MRDFKDLKKLGNIRIDEYLEENRQLRKQGVRLLQKNNQLSRKNGRMGIDLKGLRLEIRELTARLMELTEMIFKGRSRRKKKKEEEEDREEDDEKDDVPPGKCRKQRCLVHLLRLVEKLILYYGYKKSIQEYLEKLKKVVQGIMKLSDEMSESMDVDFMVRKADHVGRLRRLLSKEFKSQKVERFRKRILNRIEEFITCLDYAEVCAHNNTVERALRGNVIMRKITFGNVSEEGEKNHEVIMSLKETAKMRNKNVMDYFYQLLTDPSAAAEILS